MEMGANAAFCVEGTAMEEEQVGIERSSVEERPEIHRPGAFMHAYKAARF
jgi:hypothetical protein